MAKTEFDKVYQNEILFQKQYVDVQELCNATSKRVKGLKKAMEI